MYQVDIELGPSRWAGRGSQKSLLLLKLGLRGGVGVGVGLRRLVAYSPHLFRLTLSRKDVPVIDMWERLLTLQKQQKEEEKQEQEQEQEEEQEDDEDERQRVLIKRFAFREMSSEEGLGGIISEQQSMQSRQSAQSAQSAQLAQLNVN
jgi:hypothetical protein